MSQSCSAQRLWIPIPTGSYVLSYLRNRITSLHSRSLTFGSLCKPKWIVLCTYLKLSSKWLWLMCLLCKLNWLSSDSDCKDWLLLLTNTRNCRSKPRRRLVLTPIFSFHKIGQEPTRYDWARPYYKCSFRLNF